MLKIPTRVLADFEMKLDGQRIGRDMPCAPVRQSKRLRRGTIIDRSF